MQSPVAFDPSLQAQAVRHVLAAGEAALDPAALQVRWNGGGHAYARARAVMIDGVLEAAMIRVFSAHGFDLAGLPVALVATGGYGRAELAPYSDLDLLFLLPDNPSPQILTAVRDALYVCWDTGLRIGHAVRTVADCMLAARDDLSIRTGLLDSRLIAGDAALFAHLRGAYAETIAQGRSSAFAVDKIAESKARHERAGDGSTLLEPDLKDGRGGFRDLQTIIWIMKFFASDSKAAPLARTLADFGLLSDRESARLDHLADVFWNIRVALHALEGRAAEKISFAVQPHLAARLGYGAQPDERTARRFMRHYFACARAIIRLTRIVGAALVPVREMVALDKRFCLVDGMLDFIPVDLGTESGSSVGVGELAELMRIFYLGQIRGHEIHPRALRRVLRDTRGKGELLRNDAQARSLFKSIFSSGHDFARTLRQMHDAGILVALLPDFGRVAGHMQYDLYHTFTVDEHTLCAIETLEQILANKNREAFPLACAVAGEIYEKTALRLAMLLHDIAKGRGGDHSVLGADIARALGPQFGFSIEETEMAAWLVRHHLAMSNTALRRDTESPRTIADFAALVQSPERLRLLLILTTADIAAVGPGRWNQWKADLLETLYRYTLTALVGGLDEMIAAGSFEERQSALAELLPDWSVHEIAAHCEKAGAAYLRALNPESLAWQARLIREAEELSLPVQVGFRIDHASNTTELTVLSADRPGLFALLAGAISASGADILEARIFTLANGLALDMFRLQDVSGEPFAGGDRFERLRILIEDTLAQKLDPATEIARLRNPLARSGEAFAPVARVLVTNAQSPTSTVIEINGADRPGLLYDLTRALSKLDCSIRSARISTYGRRVVDVFHVRGPDGLQVTDPDRLGMIEQYLLSVLKEEPGP